MRNVAILNAYTGGSTGRIGIQLYNALNDAGYCAYFCYGINVSGHIEPPSLHYKIGTRQDQKFHYYLATILGLQGFFSSKSTKRFLSFLQEKSIDTLYVLNIHQYYLNERVLFEGLKKLGINIIYIMIDEYAMLGRCCYSQSCNLFLKGCLKCKYKSHYPPSLLDFARFNYKMKERCYDGAKITFVAPQCVVDKAKTSPLLSQKQIYPLDEAIDVTFFKPRDIVEVRRKYDIPLDKTIILGVAPSGDSRKGFSHILKSAKLMEDNSDFLFIHVGYSGDLTLLPRNMRGVRFISNQDVLVDYLSLADLLLFPSIADSMPSTCLDALACGTPLLCFDIPGMSCLGNNNVLTLVPISDSDRIVDAILQAKKKDEKIIETCRNYALQRYDIRKYSKKLIQIGESQ